MVVGLQEAKGEAQWVAAGFKTVKGGDMAPGAAMSHGVTKKPAAPPAGSASMGSQLANERESDVERKVNSNRSRVPAGKRSRPGAQHSDSPADQPLRGAVGMVSPSKPQAVPNLEEEAGEEGPSPGSGAPGDTDAARHASGTKRRRVGPAKQAAERQAGQKRKVEQRSGLLSSSRDGSGGVFEGAGPSAASAGESTGCFSTYCIPSF